MITWSWAPGHRKGAQTAEKQECELVRHPFATCGIADTDQATLDKRWCRISLGDHVGT